jgi:hypothetical protein
VSRYALPGMALLAVLVALGAPAAVRAPLAAAILLGAPGVALLRDARPVTVVAVSLAVDAIVVTALLAAGAYAPGRALAALAVLCAVATVARQRPLEITYRR